MTFQSIMNLRSRADPPKLHDSGDAEMAAMLAEVDLLSIVKADTGEQGRKSSNRIDFKRCPICGHKDCFSFYPSTNSWACFSDSNTTGYEGGTYLEYVKAVYGYTNTEAVKRLRELTGHPYQPDSANDSSTADAGTDGDEGCKLPAWTAIQSTDPPKRSPALIDGVVRRGHVMLLAGKAKSGKSWAAISLCVSIATGRESWLGLPLKSSGACLYIDPELDARSLDNRFRSVCNALEVDTQQADKMICKWPLRGVANASMDAIIGDLQKRCTIGQFALVVVDSCSCFIAGDENAAGEVRRFFAKVLQIASVTGATVLLVHHFGKSPAGDREAADRARGSSVWTDAPDAVLTLTEVFPPSGEASDFLDVGEYACLLESGGIREFPRMDSVHLVFSYPIHRVDDTHVTDDWKPRSGQRDGGKHTAEVNRAKSEAAQARAMAKLLAYYYANGIGKEGLIYQDAVAASGLSDKTFGKALDDCEYFELVKVSARKRFVVAKNPPPEQPPTLDI